MRRHLLFGVQGPNKGAAGPARSPAQPSSTVPWGATGNRKLLIYTGFATPCNA